MTARPRVTASHDATEAMTVRSHGGESYTTPSVEIEVTFDLHDHEAALARLEAAVADVRKQIEETA